MPQEKEPSFFEPQAGGIAGRDAYEALFAEAQAYHRRVGEASVSYLMSAEAPGRIEKMLGRDVKIVILLREPVAAAYSNWGHQVRAGVEEATFLEALHDEARRRSDPAFAAGCGTWVGNVTYVDRVRYGTQVARYLSRFGAENVGVYFFEEFFRPGLPLWSDLCRFLEIDAVAPPVPKVHNRAGTVRSVFLRRVLNERMTWKEPLKKVLPSALRTKLMAGLARLNRKGQALPPVSEEAVAFIMAQLGEDVAALSRLLARDVTEVWEGWRRV